MKIMLMPPIMIFLHVFADYHLQGILASMKQKDWWDFDSAINKNDYKVALGCHAFEWSFVVMMPMVVKLWQVGSFLQGVVYLLLLIGNALIHYGVDDVKANEKKISLANDQAIHLAQIFVTWAIWGPTIGW